MIYTSIGILIVGLIIAIVMRSIYPFFEALIFASVALLFDFFQLIFSFLGDSWIYHTVIPLILLAIALFFTKKLINKFNWEY
ncbi:hypothetical protein SAMN05421832_12611 [Psychrobacillus psychrodurans]|nr:hypothetical protein SAMN05421832_12611 [Psychrobacillus psychrodurans]